MGVFLCKFCKTRQAFCAWGDLPLCLTCVYKNCTDRSDIKRWPSLFLGLASFQVWQFTVWVICLHTASLLSLSLCATAINLLGLTWQLKPSDGPVLNNGLGAGLPVNSDVATLPSGGRGMNCSAHTPHTNPHTACRVRRQDSKTTLVRIKPALCIFFLIVNKFHENSKTSNELTDCVSKSVIFSLCPMELHCCPNENIMSELRC